ncbi:cardiolipin synthase [Propionicicella superfundia]|uniref:cardiolipin synthase n=1 Tax=Propionicicella superfundia TaxID=348582 RepID=UPI00048B1F1F|nr:cardiolipin synthase [Propionicicella superfundia]
MDADTVITLVLSALYVLALVTLVFVLVTDDRDPSTVLAWLFILALVPVLGFVAYLFLGRNYRRDSRLRRREEELVGDVTHALTATVEEAQRHFGDPPATRAGEPSEKVARVAHHEAQAHIVGADTLTVYYNGADKFGDLLADLAAAERTITLMYLIWERDELTARVTDVLLDRVAAGVEVFLLYDWLGSIAYRKDELRRLRRAGVKVQPCYRRLLRMNYRNHMKIAVVDGRVAYTGGMNMGQEYADGGKRYDSWRDTHLRVTGPVVAQLQSLTAGIWRLNGRHDDLLAPDFLPATTEAAPGALPVQIVYSSVWTTYPGNRDVFITCLGSAREAVWIQTPYFVPDEPLLTALCTAAASGTDVRLMMAGVYDKAVPWWVAHSYYRPFLEAGGRVFKYEAGFLHAKTLTMDDDLTVIGTCNWDIRSLILHDEVSTVVHDDATTRAHREQFLADQAACREFTLTDLAQLGRWRQYRNSLFRLTSRLL